MYNPPIAIDSKFERNPRANPSMYRHATVGYRWLVSGRLNLKDLFVGRCEVVKGSVVS